MPSTLSAKMEKNFPRNNFYRKIKTIIVIWLSRKHISVFAHLLLSPPPSLSFCLPPTSPPRHLTESNDNGQPTPEAAPAGGSSHSQPSSVLSTSVTASSSCPSSWAVAVLLSVLIIWTLSPEGAAWRNGRCRLGSTAIPGPCGLPVLGSLLSLTSGLPYRSLVATARLFPATQLMAFSVGATPAVVSCDPTITREIMSHPNFANRPLKCSTRKLMFSRAMGFALSSAH
ncbi:hypothetical protein Taro_012245 [Colocasia esculenta]|uniref:Uncharacterized protein n=1 Tax=Colocasia esculenta TaxID=4460 RepID=A0A843U8H0_COLES|nr:hypothetical protein [Colocasia esculenta]